MKKSILIFCTVLITLSLLVYGFIDRNDSMTGQIETSNSPIIAFNEQVNKDTKNKVFPGFFYDVGTKSKEPRKLVDNYSTPHLTIGPEKQAVYVNGKDALIEYLKENNKENTFNLKKDKLRPAKLYFTVTKKGTISNIRLDRTSGYPTMDKTMIELIAKAPGKWDPAENYQGEKVDQELVISFGLMGC